MFDVVSRMEKQFRSAVHLQFITGKIIVHIHVMDSFHQISWLTQVSPNVCVY